MANEIRVKSSVIAVQEITETTGGNTYTEDVIDENAGRSFGGSYDTLSAYTDSDIARWDNAVISTDSYTSLNGNSWTEESAVTSGTIPSTVYAFAVEYVKETGTVGTVDIQLDLGTDQIEIASLDLGEAVVFPISGGLEFATQDIAIKAGAYSDGVNEAQVNVLLIGQ